MAGIIVAIEVDVAAEAASEVEASRLEQTPRRWVIEAAVRADRSPHPNGHRASSASRCGIVNRIARTTQSAKSAS